MTDASTDAGDVSNLDVFLADAHRLGVESCVSTLACYHLNDAHRATIAATYVRFRSLETDHWMRMLDALFQRQLLDRRVFQRWNERSATESSFDERRLRESRSHDATCSDPPADRIRSSIAHWEPLDEMIPTSLQLYSALDEWDDVQTQQHRRMGEVVAMVEWIVESMVSVDLDVTDLRMLVEAVEAQLRHMKVGRAHTPIEMHYRRVDDQLQFVGPSTYLAKDVLKSFGATWVAAHRMWVLSTAQGAQFMTAHARQFAFVRQEVEPLP